jgi:hypothetical protein
VELVHSLTREQLREQGYSAAHADQWHGVTVRSTPMVPVAVSNPAELEPVLELVHSTPEPVYHGPDMPTNSEIRAWCAANKVPVGAKGRIPDDVRALHKAATEGGNGERSTRKGTGKPRAVGKGRKPAINGAKVATRRTPHNHRS